jgi:ribosomal protein S4E
LGSGKILDWVKYEPGNTVFTIGGNNIGRVGNLVHV